MHRAPIPKRILIILKPLILRIHPFTLHHLLQQLQLVYSLRATHNLLPSHKKVVGVGEGGIGGGGVSVEGAEGEGVLVYGEEIGVVLLRYNVA